MCIYLRFVCVCVCFHGFLRSTCVPGAYGGQWAFDPMKPELKAVYNCLVWALPITLK